MDQNALLGWGMDGGEGMSLEVYFFDISIQGCLLVRIGLVADVCIIFFRDAGNGCECGSRFSMI